MVYSLLASRNPVFSTFFDDLFFSWPEATKPPMDSFPIIDPSDPVSELKGWEIQMALAGFLDEDINVWHENNMLHIKGDNSMSEGISSKFRCKFHHKIPVKQDLDLENAEVSLKFGILSINIPINKSVISKKVLFGKD